MAVVGVVVGVVLFLLRKLTRWFRFLLKAAGAR